MAKIKEETLKLNILVNGDPARRALLDQKKVVEENSLKVKELRAEMHRLEKANKTRTVDYKVATKEMKIATAQLDASKSKFREMESQIPRNSKTLAELRKEAALLRTALSKAVPDSDQWKELNKELKETKVRIKELDSQSKATGDSMKGVSGSLAELTIVAAGAIAGISELSGYVTEATDAFMEQDEAMTDAMKTTNMSRDEIAKLNEELKKIDTRTSQEELLALVRIGGKLGVTGQENLLGFARAADKINVALKEDLGGDAEGAIAAIGKMVDIFQLEGKYGLENSILKVGSAVNALGMASTANEGYVVEFTRRLAGIAPNADISIDKVMGLAATLDKYGQAAEMSATSIGQTIMAMFKDTATFADIAGLSLEEFSTILGTDVNEAFIRVLEGMSKDGGGLTAIVKSMQEMHLDGARASQVLGTLSKNAEELRIQQELSNEAFSEGTSLIEEFEVKNNSATAAVEKYKKSLHDSVVTMGEELMPVRQGMMDITEVSVRTLSKLVRLVMDYKGTIVGLAVTIAAAAKGQAVYNAIKLRFGKIQAASILLKKTDLATTKAHIVAMNGASAATALLSAAKFALAGNIKLATVSMRAFTAALAANPIGIALTAVSALATAFMFLGEKSHKSTEEIKDSTKTTREFNSTVSQAKISVENERRELERLKAAALQAKIGTEDRAKAINALNEKYKDYQLNLDAEKSSNNDIAVALAAVNKQLERKIYLQAMEEDLQSLAGEFSESVKTSVSEFKEAWGDKATEEHIIRLTDLIIGYRKALQSGEDTSDFEFGLFQLLGDVYGKEEIEAKKMEIISKYSKAGGSKDAIDKIAARESGEALLEIPIKTTEGIFDTIRESIKKNVFDENFVRNLYDGLVPSASGGGGSGDSDLPLSGTSDLSSIRTSAWSLSSDEEFQKNLLEMKEKYLSKEIKTREEYDRKILELEIATLEERIALNVDSEQDLLKLQGALADKKIALRNLENKKTAKIEKSRLAVVEDSIKEMEAAHERERYAMLDRQQKEIQSFSGSSRMLRQLKRRHIEELARLDVQHLQQLEKALKDLIATNKAIFNGTEVNIGDEILSDEEFLKLRKKLQEIIRLLNDAGGRSSSGGAFSGTGDGSLFGISQDQWTQFFDNIRTGTFTAKDLQAAIKAIGEIADQSMKLASAAIKKVSAEEENALKQFKQENEKKKKSLDDRLAAGLISETQYNEAVKANDEDYEAYAEELAIKQAEREKAMSLSQAIINTALGVSMTLAQWGVPWGLIPAGIMAAMGAAEIALIASTPITTGYEEGGEIFTRRQQDGKKYRAKFNPDKRGYVSSPTVLVGEDGPEYVIPREGLENPSLAPLINSIEFARKAGRLKDINFTAIYPTSVSGKASGGYFTGSLRNSGTPTSQDELAVLLRKILDKLDTPIPAIVQLLGKNGLIEQVKHYEKVKRSGKINN